MGVLDDLAESEQAKKPTTSYSDPYAGAGALAPVSSTSSSSNTSSGGTSAGAGSVGSSDTDDESDSGALADDWWTSVTTGGAGTQNTADKASTAGAVSGGATSSGAGSVGSTSWLPSYSSDTSSDKATGSSTATGGDLWSDYGRFLLSLAGETSDKKEEETKADDIGPGQDPDSDIAWTSFVNWLATQQTPAEPTTDPYWSNTGDKISSPVGSEPTTRTVTTVPVAPTSGSELYNYLVQTYGPEDTWSDELWKTLETNLGVVRPDTAPADSAADKSQAFESSTDPTWSAFQDMLHQSSEASVIQPASTSGASSSPLYDYLVSMYGPENTWSDELWKTLETNLGVTKPDASATPAMPPSEPIPGVSSAERDPTLGPDAPYSPPSVDVPLPRPRPDPTLDMVWEPATTGEPTPFDEGEKATGDPWQQLRVGEDPGQTEGMTTGGLDAAAESEPSTYDKVVDNAGKLLSKTGLGYIVSTLFPDLWNAGGDMMKGLDDGGMGVLPTGESIGTTWDSSLGTWVGGGQDNPQTGKKTPTDAGTTTPPPSFPDVNKNGVDDRLEPPFYDPHGTVVFPDIPPYRPGYDDEWLYFRQKMAQGGVVGYADGGEVSALTNPDPRVGVIADAEDALHNMVQGAPEKDDALAIKKFVDMFGPDALRQLQVNVAQGMKIRPTSGRMVVGPGGPTDDAIPAVIDGTQPAALSSGEFVLPADAVAAAGDGDPVAGAEQLQRLSEALSKRAA